MSPRRRRRQPPVELTLSFGNSASVSMPRDKSIAAFRGVLLDEALVAGAVEAGDFRARDHAPDKWSVHQSANGFNVLAYQKETKARVSNIRERSGSEATAEGGGINARTITCGLLVVKSNGGRRGWRVPIEVGHAPPPRAPRARASFIDQIKRGYAIKMGDFNFQPPAMSKIFNRHLIVSDGRRGVIHIVIPRTFKVLRWSTFDHGSDHRGVRVTIRPKRWSRRGKKFEVEEFDR